MRVAGCALYHKVVLHCDVTPRYAVTSLCVRLSRDFSPERHPAIRHIHVKNSSDTIGNGTRELPVCSLVPQLNAPPRAAVSMYNEQTNAHLFDSLLYTVLYLSLINDSTSTRLPQAAPTRYPLSYINVVMQSWWYFF